MNNKRLIGALTAVALLFLAALSGGCGGGSSGGGPSAYTAGSTVPLNLDSEEAMYNVFMAEYNGWHNVEATQTPYAGKVNVPAFLHSMKLPNAATPDVISVDLIAGTEYTVEFSKTLCHSLGALLPDIRLYAPDGSEIAGSSFDLHVYPEEDPSIICLTFTPSVAGTYRIQVFSADAGYTGNEGYVLRVYKEMRNPDDGNKAGYPVRYTVSNSSGRTGIVTVDDIILFRRLLFNGVLERESNFNLLPVDSTDDAEDACGRWLVNVQHHCGVYEEDEVAGTADEDDGQTARTAALIVYDTTQIESDLDGIPYETKYDLGRGFNALTNLAAATKTAFSNKNLKALLPTDGGTPETKFSYSFVSTQKEMENEMGTQASLSLAGNALGLSSSSSTNYKFGLTSTTLLIRYSELETAYRELPTDQLVFLKDAQDALAEGSDAFREDYGDYYVSGYQYGGSYLASLTITTRTTEQLDKMKTEINANLKDDKGESIVKGNFSSTMKNLSKENNATITFQSVTNGMGKGPVPSGVVSGDKALDELVKGLSQFKSDIASKFGTETYSPVFVRLSRFRNLPGMRRKIDRDIPVASDHATAIKNFNRQVMSMRGYHNVISHTEADAVIDSSVVQSFDLRFNNVIDTVTSNSNRFYTDRNLIPTLLPEVNALCREMKALGDRYTFYRMLKQAQADQVNAYGAITANVGEGIEYGYSNFNCSDAVRGDIEAGSTGGKMREKDYEESDPLKNPAPAAWFGDTFDAGDNNIFCYFKFTTENKDGDRSRKIESPSVGKRKVWYDLQSGISRSYGYHFRLMPMRFDRKDYPISGLKYQ